MNQDIKPQLIELMTAPGDRKSGPWGNKKLQKDMRILELEFRRVLRQAATGMLEVKDNKTANVNGAAEYMIQQVQGVIDYHFGKDK